MTFAHYCPVARFIERLWKSVKYGEVYLRGYETVSAARAGIGRYLNFYNTRRPHQAHGGLPHDMVYFKTLAPVALAA